MCSAAVERQALHAAMGGEQEAITEAILAEYEAVPGPIREIAWAALQMLAPQQVQMFAAEDPVFGHARKRTITSACVPQSIGKTGFTAACGALPDSPGLASRGKFPCRLFSPFPNKTYAEKMRKLLLTRPHEWSGQLSVDKAVCDADFFVSYQATWGAMPVDPTSLPACLRVDAGAKGTDGSYGLRHRGSGRIKPVLWIVDGCGLHEMEFCDPRRWELPQHVLPKFSPRMLRESVVWQTVGAGFLMRSARRFKGECATIDADQVAATEVKWLSEHGVRYTNYSALAMQVSGGGSSTVPSRCNHRVTAPRVTATSPPP